MSCESKTLIWFLYLIQNSSGKIYTGISPDPEKRVQVHNTGKGAKATRAGRPWRLVYTECCGSKGQALRRELAVKRLSRDQKLELIET